MAWFFDQSMAGCREGLHDSWRRSQTVFGLDAAAVMPAYAVPMMRASRAVSTTSRVIVARLLISRIRVIWANRRR